MIGVDARYETGPLFVLHEYLLDNGEQIGRLHTYLKDSLLPALAREAGGAQVVLEAIVAPHQPQVVMLQEFRNVGHWRETMTSLKCDSVLAKASVEWDRPGPYLSHSISLLEATDYSPKIVGGTAQRIFELRVYQAPSEWQLNGIHERFAGPEIPIFHRCGIEPILYATAIAGPKLPNMTYLTPFDSLAAREAAWSKFQVDPDWLAARKHSIEQHGYTPRGLSITLFKAAAYSPVR